MGDDDEALNAFKRENNLSKIAYCYYKMKKPQLALDAYTKAGNWTGVGNCYKNLLLDYDKAIAAYKKACDWRGLAACYQSVKRYDEAIKLYEQLEDKAAIAGCLYATKDYAKALEIYKELGSNSSIANCYFAMADYEKAIEYFKLVENNERIGECYSRLDKFKEAVEYFKKVKTSPYMNLRIVETLDKLTDSSSKAEMEKYLEESMLAAYRSEYMMSRGLGLVLKTGAEKNDPEWVLKIITKTLEATPADDKNKEWIARLLAEKEKIILIHPELSKI